MSLIKFKLKTSDSLHRETGRPQRALAPCSSISWEVADIELESASKLIQLSEGTKWQKLKVQKVPKKRRVNFVVNHHRICGGQKLSKRKN